MVWDFIDLDDVAFYTREPQSTESIISTLVFYNLLVPEISAQCTEAFGFITNGNMGKCKKKKI